jgi:predicted nucleic acid-binding protein
MKTAEGSRTRSLCYVESSGLLAALLEQDAAAKRVLRGSATRVTSSLTAAECRRAIVRAQQAGRLDAAQVKRVTSALETFLKRCDLVAVTEGILLRAGRPFPVEPVRTLAAIHLATMEFLGEPPALTAVLTRDARVRNNAVAAGYEVP